MISFWIYPNRDDKKSTAKQRFDKENIGVQIDGI